MPGDDRASGWTVIATLRHHPGGPTSVQLAGPDERINADAWSRSEGWCEHCRTRRARRTTYLLRHSDGRLAQVGSSCLAEFTGQPKPRPLTMPPRRRSERRRPGGRRRAPAEYIDARVYLAHVAQAIFESGFTSAAAATRQRPATWIQAEAALERPRVPTDRAQRRADQALWWLRHELPGYAWLDTFERRLIHALRQDRLTRRELPTAAAGVHAYHQHLGRQIAARKGARPERVEAANGNAA